MSTPAAQYLRMSTEHQRYSLANQEDAIRAYASCNGFEIVATYQDSGRSGLRFANRAGLQALLQDVLTKAKPFRAILVYDVSRWGRFQDTDEAAHYEFLCRRSGVQVHYIAEPFSNNGQIADSIIKALKRSMAAEYSRELGVKCFAGQKRLAKLGYRVGGPAGFGFRRLLISEDGTRRILQHGQCKALTTDRVRLALGPKAEVQFVRTLFNMALRTRFKDVGRFVNEPQNERIRGGERWTPDRIYRLLENPKYFGALVWNRTTQAIGTGSHRVKCNDWVIVRNAHPAIVDEDLFNRVQAAHKKRNRRMSDEELIRRLRKLYLRKGRLSTGIVEAARGVRSKAECIRRWGSILKVYELVGYTPPRSAVSVSEHLGRTRLLREAFIKRLANLFPARIQSFRMPYHRWEAVMLADGTIVRLMFAHRYRTHTQDLDRWQLVPFSTRRHHITLLCLLDSDDETIHRFYLMPEMQLKKEYQLKGLNDSWLKNGVMLHSLSDFYDEVQAMKIRKLEAKWKLEFPLTQRASPSRIRQTSLHHSNSLAATSAKIGS